MQNQLFRHVAAPTAAYSLAVLRARLTALACSSFYLSEAELLLANRRSHEGKDARQLVRWLTTSSPVLAKRQPTNSLLPISLAGYVV